jgi:hypothetical protein
MAIEKIGVEFQVNGKQAVKAIKDTTKALDSFNTELSKNREGMQLLDQLTGGAVSQFQDYQKSVKGGIGAVKSLTTSFKGLKTAILSTGIGAIVVALSLIVTYWEDIKELVSGVSKEQEDLLASQQKSVAASQAANNAISATANTLKLQGKSERDILAMKKLQTDETIKSLEAQLLTQKEIKNQQIETAQRNKSILQGIVAFLTLPITLLLGSVDAITQTLAQLGILDEGTGLAAGFTGGIAEMVFNPDEIEAEADKAISETEKQLTKLKNTRDGFILQQQDQDKAIADKKKADKDKEDQEEDARVKEKADKDLLEKDNYLQQIENLENAYFDRKLSKEQQEENAVRAKYFALIEAAKLYGEDTLVLEAAQKEELQAITDKYDQEAGDKEIELNEKVKNAKVEIAQQGLGLIGAIAGKGSKIGKGVAIAQATISGIQATQNAYTTAAGSPITSVFPAYPFLQAGIAGGFAALNIAKIKSSSPSGGGGVSSPSGGGGSAPKAPAFNIVGGNSGTNQLADTIAEQTNKPSRSYVVASDVSTAQEMDRNTIEGASL